MLIVSIVSLMIIILTKNINTLSLSSSDSLNIWFHLASSLFSYWLFGSKVGTFIIA